MKKHIHDHQLNEQISSFISGYQHAVRTLTRSLDEWNVSDQIPSVSMVEEISSFEQASKKLWQDLAQHATSIPDLKNQIEYGFAYNRSILRLTFRDYNQARTTCIAKFDLTWPSPILDIPTFEIDEFEREVIRFMKC